MVLKTIFPGCGVRASLMLFYFFGFSHLGNQCWRPFASDLVKMRLLKRSLSSSVLVMIQKKRKKCAMPIDSVSVFRFLDVVATGWGRGGGGGGGGGGGALVDFKPV